MVLNKENITPDNQRVVQVTAPKGQPGETGQTSLIWPFPSTPGDYYISPETGKIRPAILEKIVQINQGKY